MALGVTSKQGALLALGGGAAGIGIVLYALLGFRSDVAEQQGVVATSATETSSVTGANKKQATVVDDTSPLQDDGDPPALPKLAGQTDDGKETGAVEAPEPTEPSAEMPLVAKTETEPLPQLQAEQQVPQEPDPAAAPEPQAEPQDMATQPNAEPAVVPQVVAEPAQENAVVPDAEGDAAPVATAQDDAPARTGPKPLAPAAPQPAVNTQVAALPEPNGTAPEPEIEPRDGTDKPVLSEPALLAPADLDLGEEIVLAPQAVSESLDAPQLDPSDPAVPTFDLVRIEQDGSGLIAGRTAPNAYVRVVSDGREIAETKAGANGEFVAFVDIAVGQAAQMVELTSSVDGGPRVRSLDNVIVLNQASQGAAEKIAALGEATDTAEQREAAEIADVPQAPAILRSGREGLQVMRPAGLAQVDRITLDSISYDEAGAVVLAGRGRPGNTARIYVNANKVADSQISAGGSWRAELSGVAAGRYVLRVDELTAQGAVASRAESPFQREYPSAEKLALLTDVNQIIVQPGNNLWKIAESRYGEGMKYWLIYGANKGQIRDPNLIYPGQIFALPDGN